MKIKVECEGIADGQVELHNGFVKVYGKDLLLKIDERKFDNLDNLADQLNEGLLVDEDEVVECQY